MCFRSGLISLFVLILLSSCATSLTRVNVSAPRDFELSNKPVDKKIPLRAAMYIDPQVKNYEYVGQPFMEPGNVSLGGAVISASERTLKNIFDNVVLADSATDAAWSNSSDVLVRADSIKMILLNKPKKDSALFHNVIRTSMKWTIVNSQNSTLYTNVIVSEEEQKVVYCFTTSCMEEGMRVHLLLPLKVQFQKTQDDIYSSGSWKEYLSESKETKK